MPQLSLFGECLHLNMTRWPPWERRPYTDGFLACTDCWAVSNTVNGGWYSAASKYSKNYWDRAVAGSEVLRRNILNGKT